jgi:hypothetical protein
MKQLVAFHEMQLRGHAIEGHIGDIISNPLASTTPK